MDENIEDFEEKKDEVYEVITPPGGRSDGDVFVKTIHLAWSAVVGFFIMVAVIFTDCKKEDSEEVRDSSEAIISIADTSRSDTSVISISHATSEEATRVLSVKPESKMEIFIVKIEGRRHIWVNSGTLTPLPYDFRDDHDIPTLEDNTHGCEDIREDGDERKWNYDVYLVPEGK